MRAPRALPGGRLDAQDDNPIPTRVLSRTSVACYTVCMASQNEPDVAPYVDPVVEAYKKDVDRTLLRERLKLTVDRRLRDLENFQAEVLELQRAGRRSR